MLGLDTTVLLCTAEQPVAPDLELCAKATSVHSRVLRVWQDAGRFSWREFVQHQEQQRQQEKKGVE
jgi:hypothetical protein